MSSAKRGFYLHPRIALITIIPYLGKGKAISKWRSWTHYPDIIWCPSSKVPCNRFSLFNSQFRRWKWKILYYNSIWVDYNTTFCIICGPDCSNTSLPLTILPVPVFEAPQLAGMPDHLLQIIILAMHHLHRPQTNHFYYCHMWQKVRYITWASEIKSGNGSPLLA